MADDITRNELTARGRASRERIVAAAARLMLARGVAATSVDEVLVEANASKSQLYHYFTGKQDLIIAVVNHARTLVMSSQHALLDGVAGWTGLRRWADQIIEATTQHGTDLGCPLGTLAGELAATDDTARALLHQAFLEWEQQLRTGLTTMRDHGHLRADADIDDLATATVASLQGGLLLAKTARSTRPLRIALDAALNHLQTFATAESDQLHR